MPTESITTIGATRGTYPDPISWQLSEGRDPTLADEIIVAEWYDDWPGGWDGEFALNSFPNSNATNHVLWRPVSGEGHGGVPRTGARIYSSAADNSAATISVVEDYFVIEDMDIRHDASNRRGAISTVRAGAVVEMRRCFWGSDWVGTSTLRPVINFVNAGDYQFESCVIKSLGSPPIRGNPSSSGTVTRNITIDHTGSTAAHIFLNDSAATMQNVVTMASTASSGGTNVPNMSFNAFQQGASATFGSNQILNVVRTVGVDFVDIDNEDYLPVDGGKLVDSGSGVYPALDIAGNPFTRDEAGARALAGGAPGFSITGDITTTFIPAATLLYTPAPYAITGDVITTFTPAATLQYTPGAFAITGDVVTTFTPAATLQYTPGTLSIVGDVVTTFTPEATLQFAGPQFSITGDVTTTFTPAADLQFSLRQSITGDVVTTFTPEAALLFTQRGVIQGDVLTQFIPQAVLQFRTPLTGRPRMFNAGAAPTIFSVRE